MDIICFHNPEEENGYLSNWYLSEFIIDEIKYTSMEQYMMYQKAILFHDTEIANEIINATDVALIKSLGRKVKNYNESIWNGKRQIIIYEGLIEKFRQNKELLKLLIATKDSILCECAVKDKIWGIGLSMKDLDRYDIEKWKGNNLLGYSLMMARDKLNTSK